MSLRSPSLDQRPGPPSHCRAWSLEGGHSMHRPPNIEEVYDGIRDASYICLVSLILIIYDHMLTFNVELESFWTLSLTWLRALFFIRSIVYHHQPGFASHCTYSLAALALINTHSLQACAPLTAIIQYGTCIIITMSSIVQFTRVYILYKPQRWVVRVFLFAMFCLWGSFVGFVIRNERSLQFRDDWLPNKVGCPGCRAARGGVSTWKPFVPILIQQTIVAAMIVFKALTTTTNGEYAKGFMTVLVRDGAIVYVAILFSIVICFVGASVKSLSVPLSVSNILLPVFSICTTRLLINLRAGPYSHRHNDIFAGVEMTGLYLGGYIGGIAPARGVEGAVVTEIGNTTIIEVPIVDLEDARGTSRCGDRMGDDSAGSHGHGHHGRDSFLATSPALKVSALGATPGWERWDHRLPTKDLKLPSASPADQRFHLSEGELVGPACRLVRSQSQQVRKGRRRSEYPRESERAGTAKSATTLVSSVGEDPDGIALAPNPTPGSRPGTGGTEQTLVRKNSYYSPAGSPLDEEKRAESPPLKPPPTG
ncbi:hypothetical protein M408DRAFT_22576 [Serendipita vermifera MAFF 305830]|uniref:DUF6533 domain-containing protein n=1 Tax=Serendipita vermifera MAFF 305830 TaxID=933852 RepID=A0A0C2WU73_SERVB|nr:hypothetical protein M408DRAFT_22576 [Serendipita vermifera MAFF 305830]